MATIKGGWIWNETIQWRSSYNSISQNVFFTSNGESYGGIFLSSMLTTAYMTYTGTMGSRVAEGQIPDGLTIEVLPQYREIHFGAEQEVSEEFYNYLVANAIELTISGKLALIAENEQKVYDAGIEAGKKSEYDMFWDTFQQNGTRVQYNFAFAETGSGALWQVGLTYKPKYPIVPTKAEHMYYATRLPYEAVKEVDFSNCTSFRQTFAYAGAARLGIIDMRLATVVIQAFGWSGAIETIDKIIVSETTPAMTNTFQDTKGLKNVVFEGTIAQSIDLKSCPLTQASIESVINALSSTASGKTATFNKAAVNTAFETSEGANDGETSAEWNALIGTKSNWTITLS